MKCPVDVFDMPCYPLDVSWEDRATLGSDPSAHETAGEGAKGVILCPFSFSPFPGPECDKPRGSGGWPPALIPMGFPCVSNRPIARFFHTTVYVPSRCSNTSTWHLAKCSRKGD